MDLQDELGAAQQAVQRLRRYISPVVAEGILRDQQRLRGERREVTILFIDAVGFTHLSESLDAESVFDLINGLLGRLVACVHRYDGTVDKFTGDGLMVVFGAPIAHENDPELAVRAALDMQKAAAEYEPVAYAQLGAPLKVRIGIHSGLAVAGILGTEEQAAYTVIGETVNLSSRIESLARPGHVLVSAHVYEQTRALFDFEPMGETQVKGISQAIAVYEAMRVRAAPLPTRGVAGVTSVFLGRDAELARLRAHVAAFLDDGHGRRVIIKGEAGMGKSRLSAEGLVPLNTDGVTVWRGRCLPHGQGGAYGIFRSLVQDALRGRPLDTACDDLVSSELRPFLGQMLGLELEPEARKAIGQLEPARIKQLTALALREWILGEARRRPTALVLEDLHWADDISRELLQSLADIVYEAPVYLCIITRPSAEAPVDPVIGPTEELLSSPRWLSLELAPLSSEDSRALLAHLVNLEGLPEPLIGTILTRAEGNPFYIEEFVRVLIQKQVLTLLEGRWQVASPVALRELEVPTSLRGLMMARVDRLPRDLQDLLRSAAVIGLQFSARLLGEVMRRLYGRGNIVPLMERLRELGLVVERPEAGEGVYSFRHIVAQETLYSSLLRSQRPDLHRAVAECMESLYADDLSNQVEVLALHYDRARVRDKAMTYALMAGDRARERFANREAIEYYGRALQLAQHLSDRGAERWRAVINLGDLEQHVGEYEDAVALYEAALGDWSEASPQERARIHLGLGQVWDKRGDLDKAETELHSALGELESVRELFPGQCARIYCELGHISRRRGDMEVAEEWLEQGLALVVDTDHYDVLSLVLNRLGGIHYYRQEWDKAVERVERALALRERLGDLVGYARSLNNLAILTATSGDWGKALDRFEQAAELHERIGDAEGLVLACTNLGRLYTERGEWVRAEENLEKSLGIAQRIAHPYELAQAHTNLGWLYLRQQRWDESARHLDAAIPLYGEAGAQASLDLDDATYYQSVLYLEQGRFDAALEWAERSQELLRQIAGDPDGGSVEWGRYERLMGRIAHAHHDLERARDHLERSAAILAVGEAQIEAGRTAHWRGVLLGALGQGPQAREQLTFAAEVFERLGAVVDLRETRGQLSGLAEREGQAT